MILRFRDEEHDEGKRWLRLLDFSSALEVKNLA